MLAAGLKLAIVRSSEPTTVPAAWLLSAGVAAYVVGLALFRGLLGTGPLGARLMIAGLALLTGSSASRSRRRRSSPHWS